MLARVRSHITLRDLDRVSPLAVPIRLEIGRESIYGGAVDTLLDEAATELIKEATEGVSQARLSLG
jgi:ATP-dependent helicase Lhr and Lhr-like helicase